MQKLLQSMFKSCKNVSNLSRFCSRKKFSSFWLVCEVKTKKIVRYGGVGKISKIALFCGFFLHEKFVIRKLCAIAAFSAKLKVDIAGFYCTWHS